MPEKNDKNNIQSIQLLRGIAAFGVMLSHSSAIFLPATNLFQPLSAFGSVGVYIFFIISGFIIPYAMFQNKYRISHFKKLMLRRIVRIEPPYIICIILILLLYYFTYYASPNSGLKEAAPIQWGNLLGHIGYINAFTHKPWLSPVFWTLAIEFEYYILIGLTFPLVTSGNKIIAWGAHILLLSSIYLTPYLNFHNDFNVYNTYIFFFIPFFLMGIALFLKRVGKITNAELIIMVTLDVLVAFRVYYSVGDLSVCVLSLLAIQYIKKVPKMLLWLGTISYSLYLTHCIVISRFMILSGKVTRGRYLECRLLLCFAACIVFACFYYLLFEKPFVNLSKRIKMLGKNL